VNTLYPTGTNSASDSSKNSEKVATSFDIRDHLDKLTPGKEKDKYICPVCEGHNLSIDPKTGKYKCFSGDCAPADIREAIRPLAEFLANRAPGKIPHRSRSVATAPKKVVGASIPAGLKLLRLAAPAIGPEPHKPDYFPKDVPADALQIDYKYSESQIALRWQWPDSENPKGHSKTYRPRYIDGNGNKLQENGPLPWPAYRLDEVVACLAAIPDDKPVAVLILEGEPNVELARLNGLAAVTMQGSKWSHREEQIMVEALQATSKNVTLVFPHDNDTTGIEKADQVKASCDRLGIPCVIVDPRAIFPDIPEKGDIKEILDNMDIEEFIQRLEAEIHAAATEKINEIFLTPRARTDENANSVDDDYIPDTAPIAEKNFVQKAEEALFGDGLWVSIGGQMYHSVGSHYELQSEADIKRRIGDWLNVYSEKVQGVWVHNRAKSSNVFEVWNWVNTKTAVDPNKINLDGLNCSNGVVKIHPDGSHSLVPHNPSRINTYVGCEYDPDIDATECDRLLECLEPQQREIFVKTAAAALDLRLVRSRLTGKGVKGLLCLGEGSNGKDTLRTVLAAIFGRGMTPKSLSDFKAYDGGRKFTLAGLEGGICNWASENAATVSLDCLQSLKQFITGDPIDIERKGKDSYEYKPTAIFLANCNKLPGITGGTAAIDDRYGILSFTKTYKRGANTAQGELEANPRFKDDENFILERIAPALLNKMLAAMPKLLTEGIDYRATREAMEKAQQETKHLWQFVRDVGIATQAGGRIYIKDCWEQYQDWCTEAGILEIEVKEKDKKKLTWNDLPNRYDSPVKAINQLYARLCEIFPKIDKRRYNEREDMSRKGQWYLSGVGFSQNSETIANIASPASPVDVERLVASPLASPASPIASPLASPQTTGEAVGEAGEAVGEAITYTQSGGEAGEAVLPTTAEFVELISRLPEAERQKLVEILTQSQSQPQPQPEQPTPTKPQSQPQPQPEQPTPPKPQKSMPAKRPIAVGDDVVISYSEHPMYRGVNGKVVDELWVRDSKRVFTVEFDKLVHGMSRGDFPEGDILRI
jgi:putative DNA primase/helicase